MLSSHDIERVYGPDTLKIMTAAFDNAFQQSSKRMTTRGAS